ncbi:MAG: LuxR family transcriptional regulator [Alphaproteobacteria bacterium]|nr:LuxR family transcriptional regulator [Alphaproteobacteria bacterium]
MASLRRLMELAIRILGFDYFALVHHVDLSRRPTDYVRLIHYPEAWKKISLEHAYYSDDPVLAASQKTSLPFLWSEVSRLITLTDRQEKILASARGAGVGDGLTVPVHIPGEYYGSCSFGTRTGREVPRDSVPLSQFVGGFAFEAARRVVELHNPPRVPLDKPSRLSRRQIDCLVLAGRGKSDRDIGTMLGISGQTVHQHIEDAKRRYSVATRQQLIVRALFDSQITFADLINL